MLGKHKDLRTIIGSIGSYGTFSTIMTGKWSVYKPKYNIYCCVNNTVEYYLLSTDKEYFTEVKHCVQISR